MKTSNLITDFLIIGAICITCFTAPYFIIDSTLLKDILSYEFENKTLLIAGFTLVNYILGILFYQLADYGIKFAGKILRITQIQNNKEQIEKTLKMGYHDALQTIVMASKNSFDYLSYRRTIIRVVRSILFSSFMFPILHLIYSIILSFSGIKMEFSIINFVVLCLVLLLLIFCRYIYIRQYNGYFNAIIVFNNLISKKTNEIST